MGKKGIFSIDNEEYKRYSFLFDTYFEKLINQILLTKKRDDKNKVIKIYSASTYMDTTSYKKRSNNLYNNNHSIGEFNLI